MHCACELFQVETVDALLATTLSYSCKRPAQVTTGIVKPRSVIAYTIACEQALCLGKKIARKGKRGGTQRLFSVKYLLGEADVALNFLVLEDG